MAGDCVSVQAYCAPSLMFNQGTLTGSNIAGSGLHERTILCVASLLEPIEETT